MRFFPKLYNIFTGGPFIMTSVKNMTKPFKSMP